MGQTFLLLILPLSCSTAASHYYDRNIISQVKGVINSEERIAECKRA